MPRALLKKPKYGTTDEHLLRALRELQKKVREDKEILGHGRLREALKGKRDKDER